MSKDSLIEFKTLESNETFGDALSELVRRGARQIIAQAVEAEITEFLEQYAHLKDESGRQGVVRNGYLPSRTITTGVGAVEVASAENPRPNEQRHQIQLITSATLFETDPQR